MKGDWHSLGYGLYTFDSAWDERSLGVIDGENPSITLKSCIRGTQEQLPRRADLSPAGFSKADYASINQVA
ncbi:hypothetical protein ACTL6P_13390 [Endozoicomonas acroporae]|uniref:hypothetical protein n=1 Tax=Endozoicomonas acroporae TaxID=1701104 RepID=UPI000C75B9E8